jgi:beta-phosphoglucomutase
VVNVVIKAFIFDLDGVITDTADYHYLAWKQLADEENLPFTRDDNEKLRGVSRRESLNRLLKGRSISEAQATEWMARKNEYYRRYIQQITPRNRLPGVTRFLDEARQVGIKLAIGSASKNARDALERLDLLDAFDVIADGYSVLRTKPAPDLFMWAAGFMQVKAIETVVFEDAEAGIDAALKGGFWTVGIGNANVAHAHLTFPGLEHVHVQDTLTRLAALQSNPE